MSALRTAVLASALLIVAHSAQSQDTVSANALMSYSAGVMQARPYGDLSKNIGNGYGITGAALIRLSSSGWISLRADLGAAAYDNENRKLTVDLGPAGPFDVRIRTTSWMIPFSVGPQVAMPSGPVRPYMNAGIGGQWFLTDSHVESRGDAHYVTSTTNQSDFTPAWTAGAGVYVPVAVRSSLLMVDVGAQYVSGGVARYVTPAGVSDVGGVIDSRVFETNTHLLVVRIGARLSL